MLEPRETELPTLFLVFVVLPLVSYFLLGKWSETSKRKEKISLVGVGAADEALLINNMAVGAVMPVVNLPNMGIHQCARCFCPATTRCSQCKSVRYCSGRCQILHWRQIHKLECQQLWEDFQRYNIRQPNGDTSSEDVIYPPLTSATNSAMTLTTSDKNVLNRRSSEMDSFPEDNGELSKTADGALLKSSDENSRTGFTLPTFSHPSEDTYEGDFFISEGHANEYAGQTDLIKGEYLSHKITLCSDEMKSFNCSSERTSMKRNNGIALHKSSKSRAKVSKEPLSSDTNIKAQTANDESRVASIKNNIPLQESNSVENTGENMGFMRMMGMKKSVKIDHRQHLEGSANSQRKIKMIFPYEEFVKCFQFEVLNFTPRGLVNCGNSCYANAVLQCLTYTKPLIIYLLRESHSRAGCTKDWCLVCELEQLVKMLRESGGPLTPVNILVYIRSLNSQIGDGSQEDAHEFLRLLVASMQSISLEIFGGENAVDPAMQNTTFIQHTFGGCLRSKVKCLRCHHESERYESMMDLTLEIFGWVESLEDALTQFTSSENLDGDNMYRCPRCAAYVRAWKQLKIQEAPNILTIVLKRFQEGNYGKINKCITFPEMLDMIPFMTGTDDIPPLYMLYAVVVHLDTSNASFSGHYISYVKDLHGNWFRVDDTEVQPVDLSHVMSEGAYILFYMRSYPRPAKSCNKKATGKNSVWKSQRSSKPEQSKPNDTFISKEAPLDHRLETINIDYDNISRGILIRENRSSKPYTLEKNYVEEFSDATTSDWSHLTSSDDSSFTTESTRDSFSTEFPFSSIFHSLNYPEGPTSSRTISCSVLPAGSKPLTRFAREEKGFISMIDLDRRADPAYDGTSDGVHVNYTSNAIEEAPQTSFNCTM